jgi:hypothetical protein
MGEHDYLLRERLGVAGPESLERRAAALARVHWGDYAWIEAGKRHGGEVTTAKRYGTLSAYTFQLTSRLVEALERLANCYRTVAAAREVTDLVEDMIREGRIQGEDAEDLRAALAKMEEH